ncbi:MAG: putative hydroxymethylpyrimidine transporter CytX [Chloroflexi bacterium]|nr:putative hydroxymethylpyrimidine transporter CytX [Chloroflexota bacterium]
MATVTAGSHELGIQPIPAEQRGLGTWDTFVLWADLGISFLVMVVGMFLVPGLGLAQALLAILVGAVIGNLLLGLAATIGSDTGSPTMVLLRAPLGLRGSYAPTILNIIQLVGWAALEIIVMAQATDALTARLFGLGPAYHLWVLLFTIVTAVLALGGPVLVTKKYLERFVIWAVLVTTVWLTAALLLSYDIRELLARPGTGEMSFWTAVDLVVAMPISWFPMVADYSRFSHSRKAAFWGTAGGYFVPHVWFYALGALLVLAAGVTSDPNAPIAPLLTAIASLTVGWVALLVLLLDETDEGFANVYSTAVSIQNLTPRFSQRTLVLGICAVVLVLAWLVPLTQYESFLLLIGSAFVPLLGLLAADFFVVHGRRYAVSELYRPGGVYWYSRGVNWLGIAVWIAGVATYLAISGLPAFDIGSLAPWVDIGASLPSFGVSFALYVVLGRHVARAGGSPTTGDALGPSTAAS